MDLVIVFVVFILYFLPTIVAINRRHQNTAAIVVINLFLGWTFLGWVAALAWACTAVIPRVEVCR